MSNNNIVPYQLEQIIKAMLNPKDDVYLRGNYRIRLATIESIIHKSIEEYDRQVILAEGSKGKRK